MHPYLGEAVRASHLPYLLRRLVLLVDPPLPAAPHWVAGPGGQGRSSACVTCPERCLHMEASHTSVGGMNPKRHLTDM